MTFFALLTKELRLRLRRERTIWVIIVYILLMGLLGWIFISRFSTSSGYGYAGTALSDAGRQLYYLLSLVQLFLIVFITPAFTSTSVNGEKERQTFDMLLCSRLSGFSLIAGKLVAGLMNALLLIAASIPLFSLVFFFGGVSPEQVFNALVVFVVTTLTIGTLGILCSTFFKRPAVSTAIAYMLGLLWMIMPLILVYLLYAIGRTPNNSGPSAEFFIWNPIVVLVSTYPSSAGIPLPTYAINGVSISYTVAYTVICLLATTALFFLSVWTVKPNPVGRFRGFFRRIEDIEIEDIKHDPTIVA